MTCNKIGYETFEEAKHVVNYANKMGRKRQKQRRLQCKKPKRVYKCPECGLYHLTSQNKVKKNEPYEREKHKVDYWYHWT